MRASRWWSAEMSDTAKIAIGTAVAGVPEAVPRGPSSGGGRLFAWMRQNLFSSWLSSAITLLLAFVIARAAFSFVQWGIVNAIWSVPGGQTQACRAARGVGACWAVVTEKHPFILFGTYPFEEQWRAALSILIFIALFAVSAMRRFWRKELVLIWLGALAAIGVLMW